MSYHDPNFTGSYAINTSPTPVYVLPQEGYAPVFVAAPPAYAQTMAPPSYEQTMYMGHPGSPQPPHMVYPGSPPPHPQYIQTMAAPPTQTMTQSFAPPVPNAWQRIENSITERAVSPPAIGNSISEGFSLYGKYCGHYILWMLLWTGVLSAYITFTVFASLSSAGYAPRGVWPIFGELIFGVLLVPLGASLPYATLQALKTGGEMNAAHFLKPFQPTIFISLFVLRLLEGVLIGLGLICFVAPGIYLAVCFIIAEVLYLEYHPHGLNIGTAISLSRTIVAKHWCSWFGFAIVCCLVSLVPFCFPAAVLALVVAFRDIVGLIEHHDPNSFSMATTL